VAEHQRDHSLYIAFAPRDNPAWRWPPSSRTPAGAAAAAPIARRVLDYLLADQYPSEEDIALVREGKSSGPPVGTPRRVEDVPLPSQTRWTCRWAGGPAGRQRRIRHGRRPASAAVSGTRPVPPPRRGRQRPCPHSRTRSLPMSVVFERPRCGAACSPSSAASTCPCWLGWWCWA
jgi:penicillin-binding protein 2